MFDGIVWLGRTLQIELEALIQVVKNVCDLFFFYPAQGQLVWLVAVVKSISEVVLTRSFVAP